VLAESGMVAGCSIKIGGDRMDVAIGEFLQRKHHVDLDEHAAETVKIDVGSAVMMKQPLMTEVRGRESTSGLPKTIEVTSNDVVEAIADVLLLIGDALRDLFTANQQERRRSEPRVQRSRIGQRFVICNEQKRIAVVTIPAGEAVRRTVTVRVETVRMRVAAIPMRPSRASARQEGRLTRSV